MYITLPEMKHHLNLEQDFKEDDGYIISLIQAAEDAVEQHLDRPLADLVLEQNTGKLPATVIQAIKIMVGNLYMNRESVAFSTAVEIPYSYKYLLERHKRWIIP